MDFSDAASSDWSIFTSSDDASFTTESTRDSFSTVDYTDNTTTDPLSSIFNTIYTPHDYHSQNIVTCNRFSRSRPHTRFMEEDEKRSVLKSYEASNPPYRLCNIEKAYCSSNEVFSSSSSSHFRSYVDGMQKQCKLLKDFGIGCRELVPQNFPIVM